MKEEQKIVMFPARIEIQLDCVNTSISNYEAEFIESNIRKVIKSRGIEITEFIFHH